MKYTFAIIVVIILFILLGSTTYIGYKWGKGDPIPPVDMGKLDSLNTVILNLEDSISHVKGRTEELTKVIYVDRVRYDTIKVRENSNEIVETLKRIAATPIQ